MLHLKLTCLRGKQLQICQGHRSENLIEVCDIFVSPGPFCVVFYVFSGHIYLVFESMDVTMESAMSRRNWIHRLECL